MYPKYLNASAESKQRLLYIQRIEWLSDTLLADLGYFLTKQGELKWKHKIRDFPKEFLLVIFVKQLTVYFQFHENKPLEPGELSTFSAPRSAVTALLLSWRRGRNQNLLYMKVQSIRRPIINSKVKKASLNIHYTVHRGCFGLLDADNIINQLQSLGRSVIATKKLFAKSFTIFTC